MMLGALWLVALALPGGMPQAATGPGFACAGVLSPTESLICGDAELSAYDRAMSFAYAHHWRAQVTDQKQWLTARNACLADRDCVRNAYAEWLALLNVREAVGIAFDRKGARGAADLTHRPRPIPGAGEYATLVVQPLGDDWYLFAVTDQSFFDPHDGQGMDRHVSERAGLLHLRGGEGRYIDDPEAPEDCAIDFVRSRASAWQLTEIGSCGGRYADVTGTYVP